MSKPRPSVHSPLGDLISLARSIKGMTLRELERATGVSNAMLSQIEHGKVREPSFTTVVKIADALGVPLDRMAACVRRFDYREYLRRKQP